MWENDEGGPYLQHDAQRWERMRRWVLKQIKEGFGDPVI